MIRISKEIKVQSVWLHMETLSLSLPEEDEKAFWAAVELESQTATGRTFSRYVEMEQKLFQPDVILSLADKQIMRLRATVGPRFFDKAFGDWPFDKLDIFADADAARAIKDELGVTGVSMFLWRC